MGHSSSSSSSLPSSSSSSSSSSSLIKSCFGAAPRSSSPTSSGTPKRKLPLQSISKNARCTDPNSQLANIIKDSRSQNSTALTEEEGLKTLYLQTSRSKRAIGDGLSSAEEVLHYGVDVEVGRESIDLNRRREVAYFNQFDPYTSYLNDMTSAESTRSFDIILDGGDEEDPVDAISSSSSSSSSSASVEAASCKCANLSDLMSPSGIQSLSGLQSPNENIRARARAPSIVAAEISSEQSVRVLNPNLRSHLNALQDYFIFASGQSDIKNSHFVGQEIYIRTFCKQFMIEISEVIFSNGNSALHEAIILQNRLLVEYLLNCGCDARKLNTEGKSCLTLAEEGENIEIIEAISTFVQTPAGSSPRSSNMSLSPHSNGSSFSGLYTDLLDFKDRAGETHGSSSPRDRNKKSIMTLMRSSGHQSNISDNIGNNDRAFNGLHIDTAPFNKENLAPFATTNLTNNSPFQNGNEKKKAKFARGIRKFASRVMSVFAPASFPRSKAALASAAATSTTTRINNTKEDTSLSEGAFVHINRTDDHGVTQI